MAEQREFQYAPGFLARRYEFIAELEDNPIFLRETGKRYGCDLNAWARFKRKMITAGGGIAATIGIFAVVIACFALLLFISRLLSCMAIPVMLILISTFSASSLSTKKKLPRPLQEEWQAGRLQQLYLSKLSGRDIYWGYIAGRTHNALHALFVLVILFSVGAAFLPLIWPWIFPGSEPLPWIAVPPIEVGCWILGAHFALIYVILAFESTAFEFRMKDHSSPPDRFSILTGAVVFRVILVGAIIIPGVIAGVLGIWLLSLINMPGAGPTLAVYCFMLVYGAVNIPLCWLLLKGMIPRCLREVENGFESLFNYINDRHAEPA